MRLTLLLRDAMLALFPFLHLTLSLLCVFGRMRKMAQLLLARRYSVTTMKRELPCVAICRNATTRREVSHLLLHCGGRWAAHGRQTG
jgi:hypothetical protein